MNTLHRKTLTPYAQKLRREMTKAEKHLWYDFLKKIPFTVHRQKVIGPYIADFYIAEAKLIIELDGSSTMKKNIRKTIISGTLLCMIAVYGFFDFPIPQFGITFPEYAKSSRTIYRKMMNQNKT